MLVVTIRGFVMVVVVVVVVMVVVVMIDVWCPVNNDGYIGRGCWW